MVYLPPPIHVASQHEEVLCREPQTQAQTSMEQARRWVGSTTLCPACVRVLQELYVAPQSSAAQTRSKQ